MNAKATIAASTIALAAIVGVGTNARIWLTEPHDKKLALYQAQCATLHAITIAELAKNGQYFKAEEAKRFSWVAKILASQGKGIEHSAHVDGLAWDMVRVFPDGSISWKYEDYQLYGEVWKAVGKKVGIETNWGGDFKGFVDSVHTSCTSPSGMK